MQYMLRNVSAGVLLMLLSVISLQAQNATVRGSVKDQTGTALIGATVTITAPGSTALVSGATSDTNGAYSISVKAGSYTLTVRYVGYKTYAENVTVTAGKTATHNVVLQEEGNQLNEVVVSASRQAEKILDAPASVSTLSANEIKGQASPSVASILRNVEGVDMAQTGVDRFEIVLRGFSNAFSGATYTLVDYRPGAIASLNVNAHSMMPISNIDLERVEIVRGPGSALYGPGVDAGVVHFITKNPFDHQGTTVAFGGGQNSTIATAWRHAGVVNGKLGYKFAGQYSKATDFPMDVMNTQDFLQLDTNGDGLVVLPAENGTDLVAYQISTDQTKVNDVTASQNQTTLRTKRDVPRETNTSKLNVNGMVEYKLDSKSSLIANAGYSVSSGPYLSGIGNLYAQDFGYTYGQIRFQRGSFFAQASLNQNNHGESYVVGQRRLADDGTVNPNATGIIYDRSQKWNVQAQNNGRIGDKVRVIYGADWQLTSPKTNGTIYGRNEDSDNIMEAGAYAQAQYAVTPKLDLTVAARADYNNVIESFNVSPRIAAVYKVNDTSSLRATFNQAFSSPGNNSLFLDIPASQITAPVIGTIVVRGRGSVDGFTFNRDATDAYGVVASSLLPWNKGQNVSTKLAIGDVYKNLIYAGLASANPATLATQLNAALGYPAGTITSANVSGLVSLLSPTLTQVGGSMQATLLNPLTRALITDINDVEPLKQTTTQTIELGYKAIFAKKFLLAVDGYYTTKENFVGPLLVETPMAILAPGGNTSLTNAHLANITTELGVAINNNANLKAALAGLNVTPAQAAQLIVGLANQTGALSGFMQLPIAIVQPNENNPGAGKQPELMLSYRNFGKVSFWGVDTAMRYLVNNQLTVFGNVSYVSDTFFDENEVGEAGKGLYVALNAPGMKFKLGGDYQMKNGFSFNLSGRYNGEFPIASGPYVGGLPSPYNNVNSKLDDVGVEAYYLVDAGMGYEFNSPKGLRLDVSMQNVTDNKVRQYYGAPAVGRYTTARLTFDF